MKIHVKSLSRYEEQFAELTRGGHRTFMSRFTERYIRGEHRLAEMEEIADEIYNIQQGVLGTRNLLEDTVGLGEEWKMADTLWRTISTTVDAVWEVICDVMTEVDGPSEKGVSQKYRGGEYSFHKGDRIHKIHEFEYL